MKIIGYVSFPVYKSLPSPLAAAMGNGLPPYAGIIRVR